MRHDPFSHRKPTAPASGTGHPPAAPVGLTQATAKRLLTETQNPMFPMGDSHKELRQQVCLEITGIRWPKTKCGATTVREALAKASGVVLSAHSPAEGERLVEEWLGTVAGVPELAPIPPAPQPTRPPAPAYVPPPTPVFLRKAQAGEQASTGESQPVPPAHPPTSSPAPATAPRLPEFRVFQVTPGSRPEFLRRMEDPAAAAAINAALNPP